MMKRRVGKSVNRSLVKNCMNAVVSALMQCAPVAWKFGLQEELTCTMAGMSSSTIFSYNGYQWRSVSGGEVQFPPEGSGFRLQPMNPSSLTQRSSSAALLTGTTPGDCGNWQTPTKFSGYNV